MSEKKPTEGSPSFFLEMAVEQQSWIDLYFTLDKCQFSYLSAPCVMVKGGHFAVRADIANLDVQPIIWGTEVNGYFTVRDFNPINCHFTTRLSRMYNGSANSLYLVFPIPKYIDHNQRRFSRRVNIDPESSPVIEIWYGNMEGGDFGTLPQLIWHGIEDTVCELGELSASGLRLDVPEHAPICTRLSINDPILLKGNFDTTKKSNSIFVLGSIVRKMPNPESEGILSIGCQFHSWRKINSPSSHTWFRADPREGIGIIAEWIARKYRSVTV